MWDGHSCPSVQNDGQECPSYSEVIRNQILSAAEQRLGLLLKSLLAHGKQSLGEAEFA